MNAAFARSLRVRQVIPSGNDFGIVSGWSRPTGRRRFTTPLSHETCSVRNSTRSAHDTRRHPRHRPPRIGILNHLFHPQPMYPSPADRSNARNLTPAPAFSAKAHPSRHCRHPVYFAPRTRPLRDAVSAGCGLQRSEHVIRIGGGDIDHPVGGEIPIMLQSEYEISHDSVVARHIDRARRGRVLALRHVEKA